MAWTFDSQRPIYLQIVEKFKLNICSGVYEMGSKVVSVRELADEAKVNPNTMQKALAMLEMQGLVITNRTAGRTITEDAELIRNVKKEFSADVVREFIEQMRKLGFSNEEIIEQIRTQGKEERE